MPEHEIISQVYSAKKDSRAADELIEQYMPFIKAETCKFTLRIPIEGRDDELCIAMTAFYEAILAYDKSKGSFLKLAALSIRNRLIDYSRREKRHRGLISCDEPSEDGDGAMVESIADERDEIGSLDAKLDAKREIQEFSKQLADFGVSLSDVADNCPKQERTLEACYTVLNFAKTHPALLTELVRTKRLPMSALEECGVERKTMERHRKYLVAIFLAYTNGYEIIRGHLSQMPAGRR